MNVEWLETFELHVPEIDGDHRTIVQLMKAVEAAAEAQNKRQCLTLIDRLVAFSESHFEREETLLRNWGYPEVDVHVYYHRDLLANAVQIKKSCIELDHPATFQDCCNEMMRFLVDDIVRGDMKLKSFLQHNDIALSH